MKIQIDTEEKVLRLEGDITLEELIRSLKKMFPDGSWKRYKLETNTEIIWQYPYIDLWRNPVYPWWPNYSGTITCDVGDYTNTIIGNGVFNIEF